MISFVWAEDIKGGIGYQGKLPWHLPADLHHFKQITMGHPIVMGRRTFESLPKILPGRQHLVLTKNLAIKREYQQNSNVLVFSSLDKLNSYLLENHQQDFCVIGGAQLFKGLKDQVDVLEKTIIYHQFDVDTWMIKLPYENFKLIKKEKYLKDYQNKYDFEFFTYKKSTC